MQHGDRGSVGRPRSTGAARLAKAAILAALTPAIALLASGTAAAEGPANRLDTLTMLIRTLQTMPRGQLFLLSLGIGLAAFTITVCVVMLWTRRRLVETELLVHRLIGFLGHVVPEHGDDGIERQQAADEEGQRRQPEQGDGEGDERSARCLEPGRKDSPPRLGARAGRRYGCPGHGDGLTCKWPYLAVRS